MQQHYRGHVIRFIEGELWRAELIERASGAILPTMVTAARHEGIGICAKRARSLVDLYLDAQARTDRRRPSRFTSG